MPTDNSNSTSSDQTKEWEIEGRRSLHAKKRFFQAWTIVAAILLAVIASYALNILSMPVGIVVWACIIVFCLRTPVNRLEALGVNRSVGTTLAYVLMFVSLGIMALLLFSPVFGIGDQFRSLIESIPTYLKGLSDWWGTMYSQYAQFLDNEMIKNWVADVGQSLGNWASSTAKMSAEGIVTVGGTVANSVMVVGFAMVVAFWVLMELPAIGRECRRLIGEKRKDDAQMLYITFTRVMGGYIKATVIQCILIGFACGIAFTIIGVPNAAALGGITGLLNIIPVVGPWLGGGLAAIVGVFVSPWIGIVAFIVTIALQQFVYTFVSPKLMADSVDVHPAIVFIALFAGSAIGGAMSGFMGSLVGMLASIPAVAAMKAVFVYYFEKRTGRRIVSEDGVFFKGAPLVIEGAPIDPMADAASVRSPEGDASELRAREQVKAGVGEKQHEKDVPISSPVSAGQDTDIASDSVASDSDIAAEKQEDSARQDK